jgi:hypothetical protein
MLARSRTPVGGLLGLTFCFTACTVTKGPTSFLDTPHETATHAHGGWVEVKGPGDELRASGELIAVSADSFWVLAEDQPPSPQPAPFELQAFSWSEVTRGTLVAYNSGASRVTGYTTLGTLATASHGAFLVFTAPLWMVTGAIASHAQRGSVIWEYPGDPLDKLRAFSRFPQGFPPGLDRSTLRPRWRRD